MVGPDRIEPRRFFDRELEYLMRITLDEVVALQKLLDELDPPISSDLFNIREKLVL